MGRVEEKAFLKFYSDRRVGKKSGWVLKIFLSRVSVRKTSGFMYQVIRPIPGVNNVLPLNIR